MAVDSVHPLIEYRDGAAGRRAVIAGTRISVGQLIDTIEASSGRGEEQVREAAECLSLPLNHVRAGVRYYAQFKDEVDEWRQRAADAAERCREV